MTKTECDFCGKPAVGKLTSIENDLDICNDCFRYAFDALSKYPRLDIKKFAKDAKAYFNDHREEIEKSEAV